MSDRKYRPVYMFIFMGLMLMVIMMNYSFNLIYYIQNRIYENAVKTLFPVETYFEDNYDENAGSVWVDSEYMFSMAKEDKKPATQTDEGVVEAGAEVCPLPIQENAAGNVYNIADLNNYDFLMKFYTVTSITSLTTQIMRPEEFLAKDLSLEKNADSPQILIFHTHSQEGFMDTVEGDTSTTIVGVGDYLTDILTNTYGYNVYHDTSVYDYVDGKLDRSKAYTYAEENVTKILKEKFVSDVDRIVVENSFTKENLNLASDAEIKEIMLLSISLKNQEFDGKVIEAIARQNPHKLVFLLSFEDQQQLAVYHNKLYRTLWMAHDEIELKLQGYSLDEIWDSFVEQIALYEERAEQTEDLSIEDRLAIQDQILKLEKKIDKTENAMWKEQQPKKKFELHTRLREYQKKLEDLKHGKS